MTSTIEVPRDLLNSALDLSTKARKELRALLAAAPVVERQPVAWVDAPNSLDWYEKDLASLQIGTKLYTAPPELAELQAKRQTDDDCDQIEKVIADIVDGRQLTAISKLRALLEVWYSAPKPLMVTFSDHKKGLGAYSETIAELQATIARLTAENERLSMVELEYNGCMNVKNQLAKELDCADEPRWKWIVLGVHQLKAEIERLKGGQGEAVAFIQIPKNVEKYGHADQADRLKFGKPGQFFANGESPMFDFVPLYTSQPAPVSVVMPEREEAEPYWSGELDADFDQRLEWAEAKGFNRAIDKVKELNQ